MSGILPQRVELDTPAGRLVVTWPQGQPVYAESLEPVAVIPPPDPEPSATLDGKPVAMAEARAILARMAGELRGAGPCRRRWPG